MTYRVIVASSAKRNLRQVYHRAAERRATDRGTLASALRNRTADALMPSAAVRPGTGKLPRRCRDQATAFGKGRNVYRALFTIDADEVRVLHTRWAGMDTANTRRNIRLAQITSHGVAVRAT